ncbi:hypothetical protein I8752_35660 [Nostocaceae cyanobacterium CENA369]|uniref:Uncharacterized protein n=1 Tax=Dendronalium phyllosphericum CENA369 TaxID=1725256 RepID=A0A8J7I8N4_9NOST|nr:hypothetical protein [Dendronalium phyllosphericum]MBH8578190.1 hypothetical protein [Dendronalium phyllosphericum CENA369]
MKTKILGLVLLLSLAGTLVACESGTNEPSGTATTTPAAGEPNDAGSPAATPATTPATTPAATPKKSP